MTRLNLNRHERLTLLVIRMLLGHVRENRSEEGLLVKSLVVNLDARRAFEVVLHHWVSVNRPGLLRLLVLEMRVQIDEHLVLWITLVSLH